uniref:Podocan n=1 Tax=Seriola lalandi dorsalis TaxID=1841481 RepID=A0A3B4WGH2_SERLL
LLASVLVRCQAPLEPVEEEEGEETNITTVVTKSDPVLCPPECSCTAEGAVDCAGVDLTEFPDELSDKTRQLSLQNNKIEEITVEHISHLHQLETFNLQNNWLTTDLEDEGFEMLEQLAYLYLANNKLTSAPKVLPPSLVSADFAANQLVRIYPYTFGHKPKLSVYLHNNKLTDAGLPDNMFNASNNLEILTMSSNFLRVVPKSLPSNLYRLHLKSNKLEKIPAGAFDNLSNLRELYLQNNLLSNEGMDNETFLKKLHTLHMYNNLLERVPRGLPRRAKTLMLLHNSISEIGRNDLILLYTLTELNLSYNKLTSSKVHREAFRKLRILEKLDMSGNNLHSMPLGLPRSLHILEIKNNQLNSIPDGALTGMEKLRKLILSDNELKLNSVYQGAWMELSALATLDLSGNQLSHIPSDLPESLEYLYLQSNRISTVPASAFEGTPNIKGIFLR